MGLAEYRLETRRRCAIRGDARKRRGAIIMKQNAGWGWVRGAAVAWIEPLWWTDVGGIARVCVFYIKLLGLSANSDPVAFPVARPSYGVDGGGSCAARRNETKSANPRALRKWPERIFPVETPCITALLNANDPRRHPRPPLSSLPVASPLPRQLPRVQTTQPLLLPWYTCTPPHGPVERATSTDAPCAGANSPAARRQCALRPPRGGQDGQARGRQGQAHQAGLQVAHRQRMDQYVYCKHPGTPGVRPWDHANALGKKMLRGSSPPGSRGSTRSEDRVLTCRQLSWASCWLAAPSLSF